GRRHPARRRAIRAAAIGRESLPFPANQGRLMRILPFLVAALAAIPAQAQDAAPGFPLELNAVQPSDNGCRVTFLASNRLGQPLARAALEMALFDKAGRIERIVTLDFKDL